MAFVRWNQNLQIWQVAADPDNPTSPFGHLPIANPTDPLDTANKAYVDSKVSGGPFVPYVGATLDVNLNNKLFTAGASTFATTVGSSFPSLNVLNGPYGLITINSLTSNIGHLALHFGGVVAWQLGFATGSNLIFASGSASTALGNILVQFDTAGRIFERSRTTAIGEWIAYTPTWKGSDNSTGVIGNGELTGKYTLVGRTVHWIIRFVIGSTTVQPTGIWGFGGPPGIGTGPATFLGSGMVNFNGAFYSSMALSGNIISGPTVNSFVFTNIAGYNGNGVPGAWAANSYIFGGGTYEY